ncbi:unnamed protein product, partial [Candidula unifasciata]
MLPLLVISLLILEAFTPCSGQESLQVSIQMNGIRGTVSFVKTLVTLTVNVTLSENLGTGQVTMEVRPIWVNYDVADKCSTAQLGVAIPELSQSVLFANNSGAFVFQYKESLASLGGYSIVLIGTSKTVCASIESVQNHTTAYAQFQDSVQGTVYFRQAINSSYTRIVSDLFSNNGPYTSTWFISDSYNNCSLVTSSSQLNVYNPNKVPQTGCSNTSQDICAVGHLSGKLGNASIGQNKMESRLGYTDRNLYSLDALNEKLLIILTSSGSHVCSVIRVFAPRQAMVEFSHDGVTGAVNFFQANPFDPTTTHVHLRGLNNMAKGYHVHMWPVPVKIVEGQDLCGPNIVSGHLNPYNKTVTDPSYPAPDASTDDMYEVGDLSSKYGTLENRQEINLTYTDLNLPLFGHNSIIGRSLVIHRNDATASRWLCSNIWPVKSVMVAVAVFKYPVIGEIIFTQTEAYSETTVFARLDYNDGRSATMSHKWAIKTNMVGHDMLVEDETRCKSTGITYDPRNFGALIEMSQYSNYCSKNSPLGCMLGDLSGRLGFVNIRNAAGTTDTSAKQFFIDVNLPISGQFSVVGRSVAIMNDQGTSILACANIQYLKQPRLTAMFSMEGIGSHILFMQEPGFGVYKTSVQNSLTGLKDNHRLFIYELPPSASNGLISCSNLGSIFNPLNITQNASMPATDDKYMIGDLSSKGINASWSSYNLPLTGLTGINGRSLVVVDQSSQNKVLACAKIVAAVGAPSPPSQIIEAVSTFTGSVNGTVHLFQTIYNDGTMSDTSILVELNNQNGQKSLHHNWHTHRNPIGRDANVEQSRCMSAGPHFDPYVTMKNQSNYVIECKPTNPLRCELGDQSSKLSTYDIGGGAKLYNDVDLPLYGNDSVLGRSMVFHVQEKGTGRLACADIIPVTDVFVTVNVKNGNISD